MSQSLTQQIETTMTKAFFDLLQENIKKDPVDYDWLLRLFQEIRTKLTQLLKPTNKLYIEIEENMNDQLFKQMLHMKLCLVTAKKQHSSYCQTNIY